MIIKSFIAEKNISVLNDYFAVMFYGENIGLKDDLKNQIKNYYKKVECVSIYQNDILKDQNILYEQVFNKSLFSNKKILFINDVNEKLKKQIIDIAQKINNDIKIFLFAENFDKKSVLRAFFEKEGNLAIIPCYQDNEKSLSVYTRNHFSNYSGLTQELINKLIKNSGVDRKVLSQEIQKIKNLATNNKIKESKILNLINNEYKIDFDNLRDSCLEANKSELNKNLGNISIRNDKIFLYLSSLTNRVQKLHQINILALGNKNIDLALEEIKPKIFWKDKPVLKKQLKVWNLSKLEIAKKKVFDTELLIKTKLTNLSDILVKKLLVDLCNLGNSNL